MTTKIWLKDTPGICCHSSFNVGGDGFTFGGEHICMKKIQKNERYYTQDCECKPTSIFCSEDCAGTLCLECQRRVCFECTWGSETCGKCQDKEEKEQLLTKMKRQRRCSTKECDKDAVIRELRVLLLDRCCETVECCTCGRIEAKFESQWSPCSKCEYEICSECKKTASLCNSCGDPEDQSLRCPKCGSFSYCPKCDPLPKCSHCDHEVCARCHEPHKPSYSCTLCVEIYSDEDS